MAILVNMYPFLRLTCSVVALLISLHLQCQSKEELLKIIAEGDNSEKYSAHRKLISYFSYDNTDSALWSSLEMVRLAKEIKDFGLIGDAYKQTSIYFSDAGLHDQALIDSYMAISYYDSSDVPDKLARIGDVYHNMGWTFTYLGDLEKTVSYFHAGIKSRPVANRSDSMDLTKSYHALGSFYYLYDPQLDSSEYYFLKCLDWREKLRVPLEEMAQAEVELCHAWMYMEKYAESKELIRKIRAYPRDSISDYVYQYTFFLDGVYLHQIGDYSKALEYFDPVYDWIIESGNEHAEPGLNALRQMIETAEKAGLYEKAYGYLARLQTLEKESIFKDRQRTTKALEIVNETKRKEQLIGMQQAEIAFQNQVIWAALVGLSIILALALFLFQSRKKIHSKNIKIEMLMRELHHRVKNNLQVISSLLGLQTMKLQDEVAKQAVSEGKQRIKAMSLIHQKLYQQDEVSALDIHEYISALVNDLTDAFDFKSRGEVKIDIPNLSLNADTSLPLGLIINELVTNALKYAYTDIEKPMLELKLIQQDKKSFVLSIRDNGPGLPDYFDLAKAESFGLKLVNILIRQLDGTIRHENNNGLSYQIIFQVAK